MSKTNRENLEDRAYGIFLALIDRGDVHTHTTTSGMDGAGVTNEDVKKSIDGAIGSAWHLANKFLDHGEVNYTRDGDQATLAPPVATTPRKVAKKKTAQQSA